MHASPDVKEKKANRAGAALSFTFFSWLAIPLIALTMACSGPFQTLSGTNGSSNSQNGSTQMRISGLPQQASVGVAYNTVLTVNGGSAPYWFRVASGSLPTGL